MDSLITAAARALASGDALGALKRVALRDDPPALALRGIAMAQLGEHARARELLRRAARGFGAHEAVARARCVVAEAEVALAMRENGQGENDLLTRLAGDERLDLSEGELLDLVAEPLSFTGAAVNCGVSIAAWKASMWRWKAARIAGSCRASQRTACEDRAGSGVPGRL